MTWYLGYIHGGRELDVIDDLRASGFDVWRGAVNVQVVRPKRRGEAPRVETVERPALPNWIFADLSDQERCDIAHKRLSDAMAVLGPHAVADMRRFMFHVERLGVLEKLKAGDMVEIIDGSLAGMMLKLAGIEADRARVTFQAFGREVLAEVPVGHVMPVDSD